MKVPEKYYDEIFSFAGEWEQKSACGLKIVDYNDKKIVVVTELYQDNPGTSVTAAGIKLAMQICEKKGLNLREIIYIECTPDTNSVLSFYDEQYYEVIFNQNSKTNYRKLSKEETKHLFI
ncbi:MAG: hypothetical protein LBU83_12710 [Bacteroidales bacterium]|jgi:hypothetical protein|nr:hypothetical protein [Bacteroidales bacterium]